MLRKHLETLPVFNILVLVIAVASSMNLPDKSYIISEVLQHFCVAGNVCPTNNSYEVIPPARDYQMTCCTDCSCASDCDQNNNCCFTRDSQNTEPIDRSNQQCLYTTARAPIKEEQHLYPAYYIVTSTPADGCQPNTDTLNDADIGQIMDQQRIGINVPDHGHGFNLGEFYPVFSSSAHKIFANVSLAHCYEARDIIPWTPVLTCQRRSNAFPGQITTPSTHTLALLDPKHYPFCKIDFHYPGNRSDILSERCYHDMIDTCDDTFSRIPPGTSMSAEEIVAACNSDFYSPYLFFGNYKNVFCYICDRHLVVRTQTCPRKVFRHDAQWFTWVLKPNVGRIVKTLDEDKKSSKNACPSSNSPKNDCRSIHCPTGHLRTSNNTCVWPFTTVGNVTYELYVKMTPTSHPISTDDIETFLRAPGENHFPVNLTSPWEQPWEVKIIWYVPKSNESQSKSVDMIVALVQANSGNAFETILKSITETMAKKWSWKRGDIQIDFDQEFSSRTIELYSFFNAPPAPAAYFFTDKTRTHVDIRQPTHIYSAVELHRYSLRLNKLYFCEQIALDQDEFIFNQGDSLITSTFSDHRMYLDAEYAIVENSWKAKARICLYDSIFVKREGDQKDDESDGAGLQLSSWWTPFATVAFVVLLF